MLVCEASFLNLHCNRFRFMKKTSKQKDMIVQELRHRERRKERDTERK